MPIWKKPRDGVGLLREEEFDGLRALDAGYWFTDDEGTTYPHRGSGLQILTLEEVLTGFPDTRISIEFKQIAPSITSTVADLLDDQAAWDRVTLMGFFDTPILEIRERQPDVLTALTAIEALDFFAAGDGYIAPGHHLHAPTDLGGLEVSQELLDRAHAAGIRVWLWTIKDAEEMQDLMEMGADGLYTDDPVCSTHCPEPPVRHDLHDLATRDSVVQTQPVFTVHRQGVRQHHSPAQATLVQDAHWQRQHTHPQHDGHHEVDRPHHGWRPAGPGRLLCAVGTQ